MEVQEVTSSGDRRKRESKSPVIPPPPKNKVTPTRSQTLRSREVSIERESTLKQRLRANYKPQSRRTFRWWRKLTALAQPW